ncbi:MAG: Glu/Leu/Phe/Val dehydrogenase, partial [Myxococcales bacterium]|nr:Glu/Leu/Phe/Val dehydrogenase [Myxococcales bacterium]
ATLGDALRDGLRLSRGMTRKNALAGLWWGGGKGVIVRGADRAAHDTALRHAVYSDYGRFITSLRGVYVTAEDAGTTPDDMRQIHQQTRFATCIPPDVGGSGNPSIATARGVACGMEAAVEHAGWPSLAGRSVAIQGGGHVGAPLVGFLLERGVARIVVHDIDDEVLRALRVDVAAAPVVLRHVEPADSSIVDESVDIFSPCALGAGLNPTTIPRIRARIVCGAANNQLEDEQRDGRALHERGILYVPDYLTNRMGIVNCADEQYGYVTDDDAFTRHLGREWDHSIYRLTRLVLQRADERGTHPAHEADQLADAYALRPHPIWGHRGRAIIASLVADDWSRAE